MGGANQGTIESSPPAAVETPVAEPEVVDMSDPQTVEKEVSDRLQSQKIRFHVSNQEIHLHDDESGIKVAIPAAEFWTAWRSFRRGFTWNRDASFLDMQRKTVATFRMGVSSGRIDFNIELQNVTIPDNILKFEEFVEKSS